MLILYMKTAYPDALTNPPNISDLNALYVAAKKAFDEDKVSRHAEARRSQHLNKVDGNRLSGSSRAGALDQSLHRLAPRVPIHLLSSRRSHPSPVFLTLA